MIAMALVCRPSLLIADEPTTALDVTIQAQILALIKELQAELDMAVLIITHDLGVVANLAEEVVVLYGGRVMEQGPIADALSSGPRTPICKALLHAVPHFDMKPGERLVPVRPIDHQTGDARAEGRAVARRRAVDPPRRAQRDQDVRPARHRSSSHSAKGRQFRAVDDVSFAIPRGECFGLVGESGCGKTTLSKVIMRALEPDSRRGPAQRPRHDARRRARRRATR